MDDKLRFEIEEVIKRILTSDMSVNPALLDEVATSIQLVGHGVGLDSIEMMALVLGLEEAFDIHIDDAELTTTLFDTVGTLTEFVLRKASEEQSHPTEGRSP